MPSAAPIYDERSPGAKEQAALSVYNLELQPRVPHQLNRRLDPKKGRGPSFTSSNPAVRSLSPLKVRLVFFVNVCGKLTVSKGVPFFVFNDPCSGSWARLRGEWSAGRSPTTPGRPLGIYSFVSTFFTPPLASGLFGTWFELVGHYE